MKKNIFELLSFEDESTVKHGLRGHVRISVKDNDTGKVSLWEESDNIIPISGYQFILMKCFGLYLDSVHDKNNRAYEKPNKDTTLAMPDINESTSDQIGIAPESYSLMSENISSEHFIQGFMIGNGGSGEDANTTKNTDYSYVRLRSPIAFQQTADTKLPASIANKYLGATRVTTGSGSSSTEANGRSYFIKKFDETPKIYHSWYTDGQKWDYVDPITANDLGPSATNVPKTNRIESYIQCRLSLDADDCMSWFTHNTTSGVSPAVNELGLVAFNTVYGTRSILEKLHNSHIKTLLLWIFDKQYYPSTVDTTTIDTRIISVASEIATVLHHDGFHIEDFGNSNITAFYQTMVELAAETAGSINHQEYAEKLGLSTNIHVTAMYNQSEEIQYTEDDYLTLLGSSDFDDLTTDEAERIKLVTCYTFTSLPLQDNTSILIDYRIYAN